jgi:hypothetical protein
VLPRGVADVSGLIIGLVLGCSWPDSHVKESPKGTGVASYSACPTDIVDAPVETVWALLTNLAGWGTFFDVRVNSVEPPGPPVVGQRMQGESGPRMLHLRVAFEFTRIDTIDHKLDIEVQLPFGITVHEALDCTPIDARRCRVNYHCNFALPTGWRGAVAHVLLSRELREGPIDSLSRLKRAAEERHREGA